MHFNKSLVKLVSTSSVLVLLSACGGSSSDEQTNNNPSDDQSSGGTSNTVPVANAGADQAVTVGGSVLLSAAASSDADGDSLTYLWQLTATATGSGAVLSSTTNVESQFSADIAGEYIAQLIVNDGQDNSVADTVTINATEINSDVDITDALLSKRHFSCNNYLGNYYADVQDIQQNQDFHGSVVIEEQTGECIFTVNEIPNHDFNDATARFATQTSAQQGEYRVASAPTLASQITELSLSITNAIMLNGVLLDILPAACYGAGDGQLGQEKIGCGDNLIDHPWRYDPMSSANGFGTDEHNAHTQPDGTYHYHANPQALFEQDCDLLAQLSPVIGYAADGFPIYGSCFDDNGTIRKALSSYRLKDGVRQAVAGYQTPVQGTGSIASDSYDGQFRGDYEYVENLGDLDECNGKTVDGQYGYFVTDAYPWVMACYKGTPNSSFAKGGANQANREHGHTTSF